MEIPPYGTIGILIFFVVVGLVPVIPPLVRALVQLVAGAGIYLALGQTMFDLPYGDDLPIGMLFGGSGDPNRFAFNKLAFGLICLVLGLLATGVGTGIQKLAGKKE